MKRALLIIALMLILVGMSGALGLSKEPGPTTQNKEVAYSDCQSRCKNDLTSCEVGCRAQHGRSGERYEMCVQNCQYHYESCMRGCASRGY